MLCDEKRHCSGCPPHLRPSKGHHFSSFGIYRIRPSAQYVLHAHPVFFHDLVHANQELPLYTESAKIKTCPCPPNPRWTTGVCVIWRRRCSQRSLTPRKIPSFLMTHGVLILGETMENCFHQAELLEDSAKIAVFQKLLPPLSAVHRSQAERVR